MKVSETVKNCFGRDGRANILATSNKSGKREFSHVRLISARG